MGKVLKVGLGAAAAGTVAVVVAQHRSMQEEPFVPALDPLPGERDLVVETADGARLEVTVAGPDDGPLVVLPHCWMGLRAIWAPVARQLVDTGHRVVFYDQRGHGTSTMGELPPSVEILGHDLAAVLAATDASDLVLAGHSMGGMTVQAYAAEHPDDFAQRVRGVVLASTAARVLGRPLPSAVVERLMGDRPGGWSRQGLIGRRMVRGAVGRDPQREHLDLTLHGIVTTTAAARAGFLVAMAGMDLRPAGATIAGVPTRILVGSRDSLTPVRRARVLEAGIDGSVLRILPRVGHMLPLEAPEAIVAAIQEVRAQAASTSSGGVAAAG